MRLRDLPIRTITGWRELKPQANAPAVLLAKVRLPGKQALAIKKRKQCLATTR